MNIEFQVHGVASTVTNAEAEVNGETIRATIPCYEVELVTTDARHGSLVLRFVGKEAEEAKRIFQNDGTITWDVGAAHNGPDVPAGAAERAKASPGPSHSTGH